MKGFPTTYGCKFNKSFMLKLDTALVKRYFNAGLIVLGKTNTLKFGLLPTTKPLFHGPIKNPWNTHKTPGGSSGGARATSIVPVPTLATVVARFVFLRCAAYFLALNQQKVAVPLARVLQAFWHGLAVEHVITQLCKISCVFRPYARVDTWLGSQVSPKIQGSFFTTKLKRISKTQNSLPKQAIFLSQ